MYTHDPVIMTPYGAILLQMAKPVRRPEPELTRADLERLGVPVLGAADRSRHRRRRGQGVVRPADARGRARVPDERGGHRPDPRLLAPHGVDVVGYDLPHFRGPGEVLHLMSVISPLATTSRPSTSRSRPCGCWSSSTSAGSSALPVDEDEFHSQGANILAVRPRVLVVPEGNPKVADRLRAAGCEVHEFPAADLCVKGDGGPTCLTQPLWRD